MDSYDDLISARTTEICWPKIKTWPFFSQLAYASEFTQILAANLTPGKIVIVRNLPEGLDISSVESPGKSLDLSRIPQAMVQPFKK